MNCELEGGAKSRRKSAFASKNYYRIGHARLSFSWKKTERRVSYDQNFGRTYWSIE